MDWQWLWRVGNNDDGVSWTYDILMWPYVDFHNFSLGTNNTTIITTTIAHRTYIFIQKIEWIYPEAYIIAFLADTNCTRPISCAVRYARFGQINKMPQNKMKKKRRKDVTSLPKKKRKKKHWHERKNLLYIFSRASHVQIVQIYFHLTVKHL